MIRRSLNLEKRMRSCGMHMEPNRSLNPDASRVALAHTVRSAPVSLVR